MSIALSTALQRPTTEGKRPLQPLDIIFLAITLIVPMELIMQVAFGFSMAFGRFIAPVFIVAYLTLRPTHAAFRFPPGFWLIAPYFVVAFCHIAVQGEWFGIYNFRTYALNAVLCVAAYNYALSNRPSPRSVLFAAYLGVTFFALWTIASGQTAGLGRNRLTVFDMDENGLGSTYGLAVVIAAVLASRPDVRFATKVLILVGALPCAALLLATGSRGALLSTILGVFAQTLHLAIFQRRRGVLVGLLTIGTIVWAGKYMYDQTDAMKRRVESTVLTTSSNQDRFSARDLLIYGAIELIRESPFVGWGEKAGWDQLAQLALRGSRDHAGTHNTFLLLVLTSGVIAGGAVIWWMLQPMMPHARLLANVDYANLYVVMVFLYGTFLSLDRLSDRQWWWFFPLFLAQTSIAAATVRHVPLHRRPSGLSAPHS
jgi:hypothetical protein